MKIIKPTKEKIFGYLKNDIGCSWLGGHGCECYSRQIKDCYYEAEKRLTKEIKTKDEINKEVKANKTLWDEIYQSNAFKI